MSAELESSGRKEVEVHFVNAGVPCVVEENFDGHYLEHGDLSIEEVLQDQEIMYQSLQTSTGNDLTRASSSADSSSDHEQSGRERTIEREGESSSTVNLESQLALDEALARALQDMENQLDVVSLSETTGTNNEITPSSSSTVNREPNSADTTALELQSLGEAIGTENRGLSEELISFLPSFKYKTSLFSRKENHEECVICCMPYKNRDSLIKLPCQHQYHSNCVTQWLKLNKACPVCSEEVFGS
ncbi:E3 ubiquitin ligase BIG BROTHER-related-like isoform X2 [Magnolia sinica]|uniref:E3 ubiquitin ligase BIG BROTHER-related-like isoform X2 n=1 Tax=Magnolia sinica TaxID=86752 RepID=UPI002659E209|nr:E3 ubiquitin ligase BIG BROTHER-related-like isoform X2 [Magnolia sinica]